MSESRRAPATVIAKQRRAASTGASSMPELDVLARVRAVRIHRGERERVLRLDERERYLLGRHEAADVAFDAPEVSRLHGVLRAIDGRWCFEDYGSANGSTLQRLEGEQVLAPHVPVRLAVGDVLELGGPGARLELLLDAGDEPAEAHGVDVARSPAARAFAERVRLAAKTRVPVFLLGASGVGKTFTARTIHDDSELPGPFVSINCARLPTEPSALHSELLGHVRGAYTGAESARTGKLVLADGGTLFLDEVESLPPLAQGFLLDVLEGSGDLAPLGAQGPRLKPVAFRLISASKQPLADSGLRPDLCERLAEGHLWRVPGLEQRVDDIPALLRHFADEVEGMLGARVLLPPAAVRFCVAAAWPGQLRQLRAAVVALAQLALARALERGAADPARLTLTLREEDFAAHQAERAAAFGGEHSPHSKADARRLSQAQAQAALATAGGSVTRAARALGISRNTLAKKLAGR
ncbi:MAG: sigma 54-interacting transcriptional regulator [Deltaproteobacteria bacterium]|nr:sigma 54-interacting transcriptional regulator [Deltaproteobacteria bacterium]